MYIELFLLDNLLLNLLIVRLAAALLSVRPPLIRELCAAGLSALAAAYAAYRAPWLNAFLRLPLLAVAALAIPVRNARGFLSALLASVFATMAVGGCAFAAALASGGYSDGVITGGVGLRAALFGAAAASFLPRAARRLQRRGQRNGNSCELVIMQGGIPRRFVCLVDTGNTLTEPVSGLPVAVVRCRALERYANIPLTAVTAAGRGRLMAFIPERAAVNGIEVACAVALTGEKLGAEAVIPPELCIR
ncbi:MAG: sigma-E processing peptidase SpoIIGA [Clostridiales bacterium]|nr:sigma-E processing peptidase SpoIIGA [Clostridiales bacterium]